MHSDVLSLENLSQVDGDWLFLATLNEDGQAAVDAAKQSSAFTRLNVVQQEHVVPVDGQLWTSANGPLAAQAILAGQLASYSGWLAGWREEMATVEQLARLFYPLMPLSTRMLQGNLGETLVDGFARGLTLGQCKRRWRGASMVGG